MREGERIGLSVNDDTAVVKELPVSGQTRRPSFFDDEETERKNEKKNHLSCILKSCSVIVIVMTCNTKIFISENIPWYIYAQHKKQYCL